MRTAVLISGIWLVLAGCSSTDDAAGYEQLADERALMCAVGNPTDPAEIARAVQESQSVLQCMNDDGPCQASVDCRGTAEGRDCDEGSLIGADAAVCIALGAGLEGGLAPPPSASMTYHFGERRIVWHVMNVLSDSGRDGSGGAFVTIDAITGEVLDAGGWSATP